MNINDYIAYETERQHGTMAEAVGMYKAWEYGMRDWSFSRPTETHMKGMAGLIKVEPGYFQDYRKVPAVFNQGSPALEASIIPNAMESLFKYIAESSAKSEGVSVDAFADYVVCEFLEIHPFADGNGRVGSLLWNWLRGTLSDPEPMPYFFGDQ